MKRVAKQIRSHIKKLSEKEYWRELDKSANFTIMFIPIEGAFQEAVQNDAGIVEFAAHHNIAIATPFTLLGMLYTIARLETQYQIFHEIDSYLQEARKLFNRTATFAGHLKSAQKSVTSANTHINRAVGSFESRFMRSIKDMNSLAIARGVAEVEDDMPFEIEAPDYDEDEI